MDGLTASTPAAVPDGQAGSTAGEDRFPVSPANPSVGALAGTGTPSALDDAVPVASFLVGKLVSHVIFGALLGAFGAALQPNFRVRAYMQVGAGLVMIVMALSVVGILPAWLPSPPRRFTRLVRRSGRADTAFAPALLGFLTVLIPCGVTLGVELLAVATGSPLTGAATLGAFVIGTGPLFAAIGYAVRRSSLVLRGYLNKLAGVAVVIAGLLSINSGLVLSGSSVTLAKVAPQVSNAPPPQLGGRQPSPPAASTGRPDAETEVDLNGIQRVEIDVSEGRMDGTSYPYNPSTIWAKAGLPTEIVLRVGDSLGCAAGFVIPRKGIERLLTPNSEVVIDLGTLGVGTVDFACSVGMYAGTIEVTS